MISGDARPGVILMTAARPEDMRVLYPVSELAARDGSSAAEETSDPDQAFVSRRHDASAPRTGTAGA